MLNIVMATMMAIAHAEPPTPATEALVQCRQQVKDCEEVMDMAAERIQVLTKISELRANENGRLQEMVDFQEQELAKATAWYRQPAFTIPLSIILGVVVGAQVAR